MRKIFLVLIVLLVVGVVAFQSAVFSHEQKPTQEKGSMMAMHEHCKQALATLDKINTDIDQAHKQNDVNSLHNSLTQIQQSVKETKEHINACMGMEHKEGEEHQH